MASTAKKYWWSKARQWQLDAKPWGLAPAAVCWLQPCCRAPAWSPSACAGAWLHHSISEKTPLHFVTPVTRHYLLILTWFWAFWQCSICFLDQEHFPVFLLWPGEKQTSPAQYIIVGIWIICLQTRTRLLSEMGYQITEIWWHTASFPTSTHPVYSEQITCKKIDFYNCSWISSHFLISWTGAPSPDIHPDLSA